MSDTSRWWSLPVNEFFVRGNWSGKTLNRQLNSENGIGQLADKWQVSSVKIFFDNCPWSGKVSIVAPGSLLEASACLTLSVGEFFNLVPWGEGAVINPSPAKLSNLTDYVPPTPKESTIDDLAQLF